MKVTILAPQDELSEIEMTPRARAYYENHFAPQYKKFQQEVRNTPLSILIWGPGESGGPLFQKRVQIRSLLRNEGHAAVFSEDVDKDFPAAEEFSSKTKEFMQAASADFVVVLQASIGSTAEVHDFANYLNLIGPKMLIFLDSQHISGYSYTGALKELNTLYGNVTLYKYPEDIDECHLATSVLEKAAVLRMAKWRKGLER
jgi:hypothetical protein